MCGRYALNLSPSQVRDAFMNSNMPVDDYPEDDSDEAPRQSYNFAPGYHGLVFRADTPDHGAGPHPHADQHDGQPSDSSPTKLKDSSDRPNYKLQSMKWGLIPFWTKRNPDYGSMMKTINCRSDSLAQAGGMWNTMKARKRCIVVAAGFYEWLKTGPKDKLPHFTKRKDGQLMCFAGLWDCVQYEGSDQKHYTYTIITTDSNEQLKFLHDRMPVILENGSEDIKTWLDPERHEWTKELQGLLKPYNGELECYPVSKEVGKVGNDSPSFVIPIDSKENKSNIANFFAAGKKKEAKKEEVKKEVKEEKVKVEQAPDGVKKEEELEGTIKPEDLAEKVKKEEDEEKMLPSTETDFEVKQEEVKTGIKRAASEDGDRKSPAKIPTLERKISATKNERRSPVKTTRPTISATNNRARSPKKAGASGSQKITKFFNSA